MLLFPQSAMRIILRLISVSNELLSGKVHGVLSGKVWFHRTAS